MEEFELHSVYCMRLQILVPECYSIQALKTARGYEDRGFESLFPFGAGKSMFEVYKKPWEEHSTWDLVLVLSIRSAVFEVFDTRGRDCGEASTVHEDLLFLTKSIRFTTSPRTV